MSHPLVNLEQSHRLENDASLILMEEVGKLLTRRGRCCTAGAVKDFAGLEAQSVVFELKILKKPALMVLWVGRLMVHS